MSSAPAQPSPPSEAVDASTISSLTSSLHSCAVDGIGESSHTASEVPGEKAEEEESLLCVFLCDFLFDTPKIPPSCWTKELCDRAAAAFTRCRPDNLILSKTDGKTVDLRGEYMASAIPLFLRHLHETSLIASVDPSVRSLDVIVGCMKHGVGDGLLRDEVLHWLKMEEGVVTWFLKNEDSVISINLNGEERFNFLK